MRKVEEEIAGWAFAACDEDLRRRCGARLIQGEVFSGTVERSAQSSGRTENESSGLRADIDSVGSSVNLNFGCLGLLSRALLLFAAHATKERACQDCDDVAPRRIHKELCRSVRLALEK